MKRPAKHLNSVSALVLLLLVFEFTVAGRPLRASPAAELQVELSTDKTSCGINEVLSFTEKLHNTGKNTIQIIDDQCGYGKDITLRRISDGKYVNQCEGSGQGHTLKPGLRPGKRVFLKPGESYKRHFRSYLSTKRCLCFQNHGAAGFTGFTKQTENDENIPAEFSGCGCRYALVSPGEFEIQANYSNDYEWSTGEMKPPEPLWQGSAKSNIVVIKFP